MECPLHHTEYDTHYVRMYVHSSVLTEVERLDWLEVALDENVLSAEMQLILRKNPQVMMMLSDDSRL